MTPRNTARIVARIGRSYYFSAAHWLPHVPEGHKCRNMHGHNYRVAVEVDAGLDVNHYVFDFIALKNLMRELTDELDHRMLVPTRSKLIAVEEQAGNVRLQFRDKEWTFPREDCVLLPIQNTTAELLAGYLAGRLREELRTRHQFFPDAVRMEVEESFGQIALYESRK